MLQRRTNKRVLNHIYGRRHLHLHTHQSQALLEKAGIPVPQLRVAKTLDEAKSIFREFGNSYFIKPQFIQTSHNPRCLSSGISTVTHFANTPEEGVNVASKMLGHEILPGYPAERPHIIDKIDIQECIPFDRSFILSLTVDRDNYCPVLVFTEDGSIMRSQTTEHSIIQYRFPFGFSEGITPELIRLITPRLKLPGNNPKNLEQILRGLYSIFVEKEATNLVVGDLVRCSTGGHLMCMNSQFTFDDAAQSRQSEIFALRDYEQEVSEEVEAEKHGLVYVRMEGNIGNVVNGAGLAMATNDAISFYGGKSANFLDAGGKATKETMLRAFDIILRDDRVTAILVNIYGGLTRCDMIAESIIAAASELGPLRVPVVVRLQGTNSEKGLAMLEDADLGLYVEAGFGEAAKKAVEVAVSP
ncbi:succinyl-CoA synthetase-like protein [Mariannaea sp. PMI_226]|nr:succinyl-CoA synthetase-like protein [Mariannaea sp. PMI_226]